MKILLTGGAGYIGSNTAHKFIEQNFDVTIIDNLITEKKELIPKKSYFVHSDISDIKKFKMFSIIQNLISWFILQPLQELESQFKIQKNIMKTTTKKLKFFF